MEVYPNHRHFTLYRHSLAKYVRVHLIITTPPSTTIQKNDTVKLVTLTAVGQWVQDPNNSAYLASLLTDTNINHLFIDPIPDSFALAAVARLPNIESLHIGHIESLHIGHRKRGLEDAAALSECMRVCGNNMKLTIKPIPIDRIWQQGLMSLGAPHIRRLFIARVVFTREHLAASHGHVSFREMLLGSGAMAILEELSLFNCSIEVDEMLDVVRQLKHLQVLRVDMRQYSKPYAVFNTLLKQLEYFITLTELVFYQPTSSMMYSSSQLR